MPFYEENPKSYFLQNTYGLQVVKRYMIVNCIVHFELAVLIVNFQLVIAFHGYDM